MTEFGPAVPLAPKLIKESTEIGVVGNLWDHLVELQSETFSRVCKGKSLPNSFAFSKFQNGKTAIWSFQWRNLS